MERTIRIREMQEADLLQAAEVIGKAFATNPNTIAIWRGKDNVAKRMEASIAGRFRHMPGKVFVAELDGRIVGVMRTVEWPGCQTPLLKSLQMMPSMLGTIGGPRPLMRAMKMLGAWKKHDPKQPHWHLDPLGVHPEFQGKGIGSQMMQFYIEIIDRNRMEAYHETDRPENVPFYQRFGFNVVGEEVINGAKNWFLSRPAKS